MRRLSLPLLPGLLFILYLLMSHCQRYNDGSLNFGVRMKQRLSLGNVEAEISAFCDSDHLVWCHQHQNADNCNGGAS